MVPKEWLKENWSEIEQAQALTLAPIPDEPVLMGQQLSRAQADYARMGYLLVDAETFLLKAQAAASRKVRLDQPNLSAKEKEVSAKADEDYLAALRVKGILEVIVRSLKERGYAIMNARNNTLSQPMSSEESMIGYIP